ncbi:MAG: potassium-transporting ATPase subunit KdpC [Elusimicrobia bacterium]|nr:potassium-transporting ATPase subunit KdpC [Elusimicrobiota bacterium]MDE2425530.1 potassium-transporting ATPase subunit KdpC [Elusimicrobiota bacterium]
MIRELKTALLMLAVMTILTGLLYPLAITGVAQLAFYRSANGSLIERSGKILGSELIGQPFDDPRYFWGRLSATNPAYNAAASSGSNYGPLNPVLLKAAQARIDALRAADPGNKDLIPVDLVTSSGSGLDPHISPAAAFYEAARVASKRGMAVRRVRALIAAHIETRWLGIFGEPRVNVLELNLALDRMK